MPDTGAPWNIPYVDPTDLVRDYPQASEDLADAVAVGLSAANNAGIGSNVVHAARTTTQSSSVAAGGVVAVADLTCTFTPTSNTAKVLLLVSIAVSSGSTGGAGVNIIVKRDGTAIAIGGADGNRTQVTAGSGGSLNVGGIRGIGSGVALLIDAPASAVAVDYTVDIHNTSAGTETLVVNRGGPDDNISASGRASSTITAIEVAA
jgi:hypothetical protein